MYKKKCRFVYSILYISCSICAYIGYLFCICIIGNHLLYNIYIVYKIITPYAWIVCAYVISWFVYDMLCTFGKLTYSPCDKHMYMYLLPTRDKLDVLPEVGLCQNACCYIFEFRFLLNVENKIIADEGESRKLLNIVFPF